MAELLGSLNTVILQLPIGFIRVVELPMAILAFTTTSGYGASGSIKLPDACKPQTVYPLEFQYPFEMAGQELPAKFCNYTGNEHGPTLFEQGYTSSSQFFVFTGIISLLYILAILAVYLKLWSMYESDPRYAMADFGITAVIALFWFCGSVAWWSGVDGLKDITSVSALTSLIKKVPPCNINDCQLSASWNYASLNVSLIAGFTCFALWAANLWFIYKETVWFKSRHPDLQSGPYTSGNLPGQTPQSQTYSSSSVGQPAYR